MEITDIYIVVLVLLIIFAAIVYYLFTLDRKIKKLEKEKKQNLLDNR